MRAVVIVLRLRSKKRRGALPEPGGACCWSGQGRGLAAGAPRAAWPDLLRGVAARGPRWCGLPGAGRAALRCSRGLSSDGRPSRGLSSALSGGGARRLSRRACTAIAAGSGGQARPARPACACALRRARRGRFGAGACACASGGLARRASAACRGTAPRAPCARGAAACAARCPGRPGLARACA